MSITKRIKEDAKVASDASEIEYLDYLEGILNANSEALGMIREAIEILSDTTGRLRNALAQRRVRLLEKRL